MTGKSSEISQWDRYWSYGNIHSFSQVAGGNYEGAVAEFWKSSFEPLADGSHVLDIATGNGAVALLALEVADSLSKRYRISGTDLAGIDPARQVTDASVAEKLKRIEFHGRTPAEDLPFEDASVDMACSQFGLEYSDLSESGAELARVLRPGGRLAIIAHHHDSALLAATHRELDDLNYVLDEVKLYLRARNVLRAMAGASGPDKTAGKSASAKLERKRRSLQEAMERIQEAADRSENPAMLIGPARYIHEVFAMQGRSSPQAMQKWLDEAQQRVMANRQRLMDMVAAARNADDIQTLRRQLAESGLRDVDAEPFALADSTLLGWRIEARRCE